jgi:hypothetical protein
MEERNLSLPFPFHLEGVKLYYSPVFGHCDPKIHLQSKLFVSKGLRLHLFLLLEESFYPQNSLSNAILDACVVIVVSVDC